jgi:Domain of unknown function (DUF4476)
MKRISTILMLLFVMFSAKANHFNSEMVIKMNNSSPFTVIFDDVTFPQTSGSFHLNDINPGRHAITVYKLKRHGYHHTSPVVVYRGLIDIPASSIVTAVVRHHHLNIINITPFYPPPVVYNAPYQPAYYGMTEASFNELTSIIRSKSFDNSRLVIAKQALRTQPMSSRQIAEIIDLLTFDSSRLEFAKYAYQYVTNPASYYLTYDKFTFESSVTELIDFISHNS